MRSDRGMNSLSRILAIKIALTIIGWCIPLLLFPTTWLSALGFPLPEPILFLRLLGMAYTALVVGYAFGLCATLRGAYPGGVVWVGIVSNGGAFLLLLMAAINGAWNVWGDWARMLMWASLLATAGITAALVRFGPMRRGVTEEAA